MSTTTSPINQIKDESTIFSIVPFAMKEHKPGVLPGYFEIDACRNDTEPQRIVVGPSLWIVTVARQTVRISQPSHEIARSIVQDFLDGQLFIDEDARPGICWLQGNIKTEDFVKRPEFKIIRESQRKWYILIVKKTEEDWLRYHNYKVVTDQARFAVRALGLETPEWMSIEEVGLKFSKCPACSTMNDPANAICSNCSCVLDKTKFDKLAFAK
jgi:hypothetical protein